MDAALSETLTTALAAVGLTPKDLAGSPRQWSLGRFQFAGAIPAATPAGSLLAVRRLDVRLGRFVNGWLIAVAYSHRLTTTSAPANVVVSEAQACDVMGATAWLWTESGNSAPVIRPINEALGGSPFGLQNAFQAVAASELTYTTREAEAVRTFPAVPPDVIDLQNDTLQYQYGVAATVAGGATAPAASPGQAFGILTSIYGIVLERGALPGRPGGTCDDKAVANQVSPQRMALAR